MSDFPTVLSLSEIDLSEIDSFDRRYQISFSEDNIDFLVQSIKETGLITPPVVRPVNNKFIIISGFNRIRAQLKTNEKKCIVYQTRPDTEEYQCHLIAITALAFKRPMSHAELILSVHRLSQFLEAKTIAQKSRAVFNTQLNIGFVKDLIAISSLPDPAMTLIHDHRLSFKSAKRLTALPTETVEVFLKIFSHIKASQNKQLEVILYLTEITAREGITPREFFQNQWFQDILCDENTEPGLKTTRLRTALFEHRFPTIFKTRKKISGKIESVKFGRHIRFLPPENFESRQYTTSFTAKTYDEFKDRVDHLAAMLEKKELKEILNS